VEGSFCRKRGAETREGSTSWRQKATRGSASEPSGNTGLGGTDPQDATILGAATAVGSPERKRRRYRSRQTARRTGQVETPGPLPAGETL